MDSQCFCYVKLIPKLYPTSRIEVTSWSLSTCMPVFEPGLFVVPRIYCGCPGELKIAHIKLVFVQDASLYFTNRVECKKVRDCNHECEVWGRAERGYHYCKWGHHIQNLIPSLDKRLTWNMQCHHIHSQSGIKFRVLYACIQWHRHVRGGWEWGRVPPRDLSPGFFFN